VVLMERTLILVVTHRGLSDDTAESIDRTRCPSVIKVKGLADIVKARCVAFDQALASIAHVPEIDTVLCIDDDMVFSPEDAAGVVRLSRELGECVSALACSEKGVLNVRPFPGELSQHHPRHVPKQLWLTGLAFMAVPRRVLEALEPTLPKAGGTRLWTGTGLHPSLPDEWTREDFWFCLSVGGVVSAPLAVGHLKPQVLKPDPASVARVQSYRPPN
jgi:hypothetical protein